MKDVSKAISHSALYHHAIGTKAPEFVGMHGLASPSLNASFSSQSGGQGHHSGYTTPIPATPLSAALGPAAQATVANLPGVTQVPREYFEPPTSRRTREHERHDTPMQHGQLRRQEFPR